MSFRVSTNERIHIAAFGSVSADSFIPCSVLKTSVSLLVIIYCRVGASSLWPTIVSFFGSI